MPPGTRRAQSASSSWRRPLTGAYNARGRRVRNTIGAVFLVLHRQGFPQIQASVQLLSSSTIVSLPQMKK
jgi:hypothetical protein